MRRRDFIALVGGTMAAWPVAGRAQPVIPRRPVIGFVSSSNPSTGTMNAFHQGLNDGGYVVGKNIAIEYRMAAGEYDRLPEFFADVIRQQVSLIVASGGLVSAMAAREATRTIPILFIAGFDPIQMGLADSFSRPGGNATGVSMITTEMAQKRLEWLTTLVPQAATIAVLGNHKTNIYNREVELLEASARARRLKLVELKASSDSEIDAAFAAAARQRVEALSVSAHPFFNPRRAQVVALAAQYRIPTIYPWREFVSAGGLMSYGPTFSWAYREIGRYASRILKGEKPSDLPIQLPMKFELAINIGTAKALGLPIPGLVLASATEIIE